MSNRGGGFNPNRGRGYNGGAGRGNGGGRWNGGGGNFGPGRGNNFFEGSSSGTAGQGDGNRDSEYRGGGFDGVFRAGYGNSEGDRGRSNYGQGYNRTADRRPYAGQGNFAYRRTNTGTGARDTRLDSARPASFESDVQGLSAEQVLLVKEAANAFAKQLAGLSNGSQGAAQRSTAPSVVQPVDAPGRQTQGVQRAEATLLAVAGISTQVDDVATNQQSADFQMAKKKKGSGCFRCGQAGHCLNDCKAIICECCQSTEHISSNCPLLSAPKPNMVMYGLAHEELMFWDVPMSTNVRPRLENTRMGRVTISGGELTIPEIIVQLQWIVPDEAYQWDVVRVEDNVYRVNFPSKMDLVRVQHFGRFNVPNSEIYMSFDFWKRSVEPIWRAHEVWVRVYDLPTSVLDDYLAMWSIGNLFGKTIDIDITFTRANDVLRMYIICLDPSLIPARMDIRVQDEFYRMRFEVEGDQPVRAADVVMNEANNGEGDMEHDGPNGNIEQPGSVDENNSVDQQSGQNGTTNLPSDIQGQRLALSPFQFGVAGSETFLNGEMLLAVPKSPNVKFSAEIENRLQGFECSQSLATEFAAEMTNRVHVQNLSPIVQAASFAADDFVGLTEHSPAQPDAQENLLAAQPSMHEAMQGTSIGGIDEAARPTTPCTVSTPVGVPEIVADPIKGKPSLDEVINFGGILPNAEVGLRSSDRLRAQPNADATQLERAMMIAQQRNNLHTQGYTTGGFLDTTMGVPPPGRSAGDYGYWMQPYADGYSGFLLPGYWVATH